MSPSIIFAFLGSLSVVAVPLTKKSTLEKRITVLSNAKGVQRISPAAMAAPEVEVAV